MASKPFKALILYFVLGVSNIGYCLEPEQILIIANSDIEARVRIANYYCGRRNVPLENILALPLGDSLEEKISREQYLSKLVYPIRSKLYSPEFT